MKTRLPLWLLVAIDGFVAITAIAGGIELVVAGDARFSRTLLMGTPFSDFVVPGVILATLVGGTAAVAAVSLMARRSTLASVFAGAVLAGWIAGEVLMLDQPHPTWIEALYLCLGVLMALGANRLSEEEPRCAF